MTNVTKGEIVSATVNYTNADDDSRKWDISAQVLIDKEKVLSFQNGVIYRRDTTPQVAGTAVGNFSLNADDTFYNVVYSNADTETRHEIMNAIDSFVQSVKENAQSVM